MFGFFSKKLTEYSKHYLDWSRIGELLKSGKHRYNKDELLIRGAIVATSAAAGFLAVSFNDVEKTKCSDLTVGLAAILLSFTLSHAIVIYPLVKKRYKMQQDCANLIDEIRSKTSNRVPPITENENKVLQSLIEKISNLSLSDEQQARASQTWGMRKRLLGMINETVNENNFLQPILSLINEAPNTATLKLKGP